MALHISDMDVDMPPAFSFFDSKSGLPSPPETLPPTRGKMSSEDVAVDGGALTRGGNMLSHSMLSGIPPSRLMAICHPSEPAVSEEINSYFLSRWPFPEDKHRQKFVDAGFALITCFFFPKAQNDRIVYACKLLTILFLIDDLLEHLSLDTGRAYNDALKPLCLGTREPDPLNPVEGIMSEVWSEMRAFDPKRTEYLIQPTFQFMDAQTDSVRLSVKELGPYLRYREVDVGEALLAALVRFTMCIDVPQSSLSCTSKMERYVSKHIAVVNDIYSYPKEVIAAQEGHKEGGALCTAVQILADETSLGAESASRVLWQMIREWELEFQRLCDQVLRDMDNRRDSGIKTCDEIDDMNGFPTTLENENDELKTYVGALEYLCSGNEAWSRISKRYHDI